jgi:hypothetical protein
MLAVPVAQSGVQLRLTSSSRLTEFNTELERVDVADIETWQANRDLQFGECVEFMGATESKPDGMRPQRATQRAAQWPTAVPLVLVNLIPVIGVLAWEWDFQQIVLAYWAEVGIVAFYTWLKSMVIIIAAREPLRVDGKPVSRLACVAIIAVASLLFAGVFAVFMDAHYSFLSFVFGVRFADLDEALPLIGVLFASHGWSFVFHFLFRGERARVLALRATFKAPFLRLLTMHIAIIGAGLLFILLSRSVVVLFALVTVKTAMDLRAHLKEHAVTAA